MSNAATKTAVGAHHSDSEDEGTPDPIVDYSCVTPFDDAVAEVERFLRECASTRKQPRTAGSPSATDPPAASTTPRPPRTFKFFFPLQRSRGATNANAGRRDLDSNDMDLPSTSRPTNCTVELYEADTSVLHPLHLHFGIVTFLVLKYDGAVPPSHSDGVMLLSIAASATQFACVAIPCFALVSQDGQGLYKGSLHAPAPWPLDASGLSATWNRPTVAEVRLPIVAALVADATDADKDRTRLISATFHMAVTPLSTLFRDHHGATPVSTLEGLVDAFRLNAGTLSKFVTVPGLTPCPVAANVLLQLLVHPPTGDAWPTFVEEQINGVRENVDSSRVVVLDPTMPRAFHCNVAVLRSASYRSFDAVTFAVGTSVCPYRWMVLDAEWSRIDVESPAVTDNAVRSSLFELCDVAADGTREPTVPPGLIALGLEWRAASEVSSRAVDKVCRYIDMVQACLSGEESQSPSGRSPLQNANLILKQSDRLATHLDHLLPEVLSSSASSRGRAAADMSDGSLRYMVRRGAPLLERFASECGRLNSVEECYLLWLTVVDRLTKLLDQAESQPSSFDTLIALLAGDGSLSHTWVAHDVLMGKVEALITCLKDEAWRRQMEKAASSPSQTTNTNGHPLTTTAMDARGAGAGDGWGSDIDFESCTSGEAEEEDRQADSDEGAATIEVVEKAAASVHELTPSPAAEAGNSSGLSFSPPSQHPTAVSLLCHPGVPVLHPEARRKAPQTRDTAEREAATLVSLGDTADGQRRRAQLQLETLVEDMQRFKHANGAPRRRLLLADFVRWHSPKDFITSRLTPTWRVAEDDPFGLELLSPRMQPPAASSSTPSTNLWMDAWLSAPNTALPLLAYEPTLEARRILRYLGMVEEVPIGYLALHSAIEALSGALTEGVSSTLRNEADTDFAMPIVRNISYQLRRRLNNAMAAMTADDFASPTTERGEDGQEDGADVGGVTVLKAQYQPILDTLQAMDVLASTVAAVLKAAATDTKCDGNGRAFGKPTASIGPRLAWIDQLLKNAWDASPWVASSSSNGGHVSSPPQTGILANYSRSRPRSTVPDALWNVSDMPSVLLMQARHTMQQLPTSSTARPGVPVTVRGVALAGQDSASTASSRVGNVTLALRRIELEGYALRPMSRPSDGGNDATTCAQRLSMTMDFMTGECHAAWMLSECI